MKKYIEFTVSSLLLFMAVFSFYWLIYNNPLFLLYKEKGVKFSPLKSELIIDEIMTNYKSNNFYKKDEYYNDPLPALIIASKDGVKYGAKSFVVGKTTNDYLIVNYHNNIYELSNDIGNNVKLFHMGIYHSYRYSVLISTFVCLALFIYMVILYWTRSIFNKLERGESVYKNYLAIQNIYNKSELFINMLQSPILAISSITIIFYIINIKTNNGFVNAMWLQSICSNCVLIVLLLIYHISVYIILKYKKSIIYNDELNSSLDYLYGAPSRLEISSIGNRLSLDDRSCLEIIKIATDNQNNDIISLLFRLGYKTSYGTSDPSNLLIISKLNLLKLASLVSISDKIELTQTGTEVLELPKEFFILRIPLEFEMKFVNAMEAIKSGHPHKCVSLCSLGILEEFMKWAIIKVYIDQDDFENICKTKICRKPHTLAIATLGELESILFAKLSSMYKSNKSNYDQIVGVFTAIKNARNSFSHSRDEDEFDSIASNYIIAYDYYHLCRIFVNKIYYKIAV